jgi:hypothetical protein
LISFCIKNVDLGFSIHAGEEGLEGREIETGGEVYVGHCGWC